MTAHPIIGGEYLVEEQSLRALTANDLINRLAALASPLVLDRDLTAPPGSPSEGDTYIVGGSATGDWSGEDGNIAAYYSGWIFVTPRGGMTAYVSDEKLWLGYSSVESVWHPLQEDWSSGTEHWTGRYSTEGDPIYAKMLDFGALPNTTNKGVNHSITGVDLDNHLRMDATSRNNVGGLNAPIPSTLINGGLVTDILINDTQVVIQVNWDASGFTTKIRLEYCKT